MALRCYSMQPVSLSYSITNFQLCGDDAGSGTEENMKSCIHDITACVGAHGFVHVCVIMHTCVYHSPFYCQA
jgi:hypothetical protein